MATLDLVSILSIGLVLSVLGGVLFRVLGSIAAKRDPSSGLAKFCAFMLSLCNDLIGAFSAASNGKSVLSPQVIGDQETLVSIARAGYHTYRLASDGKARDGSFLPSWEELPVAKQDAYIALAAKTRSPS